MKSSRIILPALVCAALWFSVQPGRAQSQPEPEPEPRRLALELSQLAESWLHAPASDAAARLDALVGDDRLGGELPRWVAGMRAALALEAGDVAAAQAALQPGLDAADNPRPFLRAARLLLALGYNEQAIAVIRQGLARDAQSPSLRRFVAGLLWLSGDFENAARTYAEIIADDKRETYPYVAPNWTSWDQVRPWGAPEAPPAPAAPMPPNPFERDPGGPTEWQPEPMVDLFEPDHWYTSDLPGLGRMVQQMALSEAALTRARADLPGLHEGAEKAQAALDSFRGGDAVQRAALARDAALQRARALIAARVCALADLAAGRHAECESVLRSALELNRDDTAVLDLMAQVMAARGKAEEARTGPLARLNQQGLVVAGSAGAQNPQMLNRLFEPALALLKVNRDAGRQQFESIRTSFGPEHSQRTIQPDVIGIWLAQRGETELALHYLRDAARQLGFDAGRALVPAGVVVEYALLGLEPIPAEEAEAAVLRQTQRAGLLLGSILNPAVVIKAATGLDSRGGSFGAGQVLRGAQMLDGSDARVRELLLGWHVKLSAELTPAQLDAVLAPEHEQSRQLAEQLQSLAEGVQSVRDTSNWRAQENLRMRAGYVLGMVEGRALLLRARLRHQPPKNAAELREWLRPRQATVDVRQHLRGAISDEAAARSAELSAAGLPEVFHSGLLLDAAKELARAGNPGAAANLLWLNRDAPLGIDSRQRRLWIAGALAHKAGQTLLAARCRLAASQVLLNRAVSSDMTTLAQELPQLRAELEEFGAPGDLHGYIESVLSISADPWLHAAIRLVAPQLPPSALMRGEWRETVEGLFRSSIRYVNYAPVSMAWETLITAPEGRHQCRRLALWIVASDLPQNLGRGLVAGLGSANETVRCWAMLHSVLEPEPAAGLARLLQHCAAPAPPPLARTSVVWK